jgi:hypothetical protein
MLWVGALLYWVWVVWPKIGTHLEAAELVKGCIILELPCAVCSQCAEGSRDRQSKSTGRGRGRGRGCGEALKQERLVLLTGC